ncbi:hypothetical protein GCM10009759_02970 [Kitasatospora saccharophila]|uniref:Uncharacterized protein n=1 Tax=Kitasatospora saccharophila TaxID=407973 RepID=A0ABN2W7W6_9ACTN
MSTPPPPGPYGQPDPYGPPGRQPPPPPPYGYPQPPAYGQQPAYGQPPAAPAYGQQPPSGHAQPPAYGQPPGYGQQPPAPTYGQPPAYGQQPAYGQPPAGDGKLPAWGQEPPREPVKPLGPATPRTVLRRTALVVVLLGLAAGLVWLFIAPPPGPAVGDCLDGQHRDVSCSASGARWKVEYRKDGAIGLLSCSSTRPGTTPYDDKYGSRKHTTRYRLCLRPVNGASTTGTH